MLTGKGRNGFYKIGGLRVSGEPVVGPLTVHFMAIKTNGKTYGPAQITGEPEEVRKTLKQALAMVERKRGYENYPDEIADLTDIDFVD